MSKRALRLGGLKGYVHTKSKLQAAIWYNDGIEAHPESNEASNVQIWQCDGLLLALLPASVEASICRLSTAALQHLQSALGQEPCWAGFSWVVLLWFISGFLPQLANASSHQWRCWTAVVEVLTKQWVLQVQAEKPEQAAIVISQTFAALLPVIGPMRSDAERDVLGHAGICWQKVTPPSMLPSWAPSSAGEHFTEAAYLHRARGPRKTHICMILGNNVRVFV